MEKGGSLTRWMKAETLVHELGSHLHCQSSACNRAKPRKQASSVCTEGRPRSKTRNKVRTARHCRVCCNRCHAGVIAATRRRPMTKLLWDHERARHCHELLPLLCLANAVLLCDNVQLRAMSWPMSKRHKGPAQGNAARCLCCALPTDLVLRQLSVDAANEALLHHAAGSGLRELCVFRFVGRLVASAGS